MKFERLQKELNKKCELISLRGKTKKYGTILCKNGTNMSKYVKNYEKTATRPNIRGLKNYLDSEHVQYMILEPEQTIIMGANSGHKDSTNGK